MFQFNKNIYSPKIEEKDINSLLKEVDKMVLISGDFWGIQKFIFERISTKNASKVLRAKSAFIQIFTKYITRYICDYFGIEEKYIISESAGKFEILIPQESVEIEDIQNKIDNYFRDNYYGINGIVLSIVKCEKEDFLNENRYRKLRDKTIPHQIEIDRFKKFNLSKNSPLLQYKTNIDNQSLCKICNIRKIEEEEEECCKICKTFKELGRKLTKKEPQHFKIKDINNFEVNIPLNKQIKSYVPRDGDEPLDFGKIAQNSCKGGEEGLKTLAVLKADVDNMGKFLRDNQDITKDFSSFNHFSQGLDSFFSEYIVDILREKDGDYRNIYTVFTGGDDLFLIGAWDETLKFARFIRNQFREYVNNQLTISFGIAIAKPTTPISYLAEYTEHLLEEAKDFCCIQKEKKCIEVLENREKICNDKSRTDIRKKDAICLFGEIVKWDSYLDRFPILEKAFRGYKNIATSTLYRLLDFCNMSKKVKQGDIEATIWKSKLNYLFYRNMNIDNDKNLMETLAENIEKYPKETKMFLVEFIYKRRKA